MASGWVQQYHHRSGCMHTLSSNGSSWRSDAGLVASCSCSLLGSLLEEVCERMVCGEGPVVR